MAIISRLLTVTQGNLNNNHLYLSQVMDLFPADAIGGANSSHAAPRKVHVEWGSGAVDTDIDRSKNIFRSRAWVARFVKDLRIRAGDRVLLEQLAPYLYRLSKAEGLPHEPQPTVHDIKQVVRLGISPSNENSGSPFGCGRSHGALERPLRAGIVRRDRSTCQSCGRRTKGQVHHILPRRRGGPDIPANLVTLCGRCHMLISPIPVDVLCGALGISVGELIVQKAEVEVAVHSWVLAHSEEK